MYKLVFILFAAIAIASCIKKEVYPSQPVITYKNFLRYGSNPASPDSMELVVSFTDNEGDIGLESSDTNGIFKRGNFWMIYLYDSSGVWAAGDSNLVTPQIDTIRKGYRIPPEVLPPDDASEPMKGLIYIKQKKIPSGPPIVSHKKIKYIVYLYDKAFHKSDTIHTPAIIF